MKIAHVIAVLLVPLACLSCQDSGDASTVVHITELLDDEGMDVPVTLKEQPGWAAFVQRAEQAYLGTYKFDKSADITSAKLLYNRGNTMCRLVNYSQRAFTKAFTYSEPFEGTANSVNEIFCKCISSIEPM